MDIYLSTNNRNDLIRLPIIPSEITISREGKTQTIETARHGDLTVIGKHGIRSLSFSSFFPRRKNKYSFQKDNDYDAYGYVKKINDWMLKGYAVRVVIPSMLNVEFAINSFEYKKQDGSGDIYYSLEMVEFKRIRVK